MDVNGWLRFGPRSYFRAALVAVAFCALLTGAAQRKQTSADPGNAAFTISDNVDLVLLDVAVKDPHDGYVSGLKKSDFTVFDDGRKREITQFSEIDTPVTIGLVVDNSGSMRNKRQNVIMAGLSFAKESNPQDEFFVVNFNDSVTRGLPVSLPFTDNFQELRKALYYGEPVGRTALYDAVAYSLKHLELSHRDKRTLIVVSDGADNVSAISLSDLVRVITASRATIYTVGMFDPDARDSNPGVLRKIASVSGGSYFQPQKFEDVFPVFDQISGDIRHRYTIGFVPEEVNDRKTVRAIKVIAQDGKRKLVVKTRTMYTIGLRSGVLAQSPQHGSE